MNKILYKLEGIISYPITILWSLLLITYINLAKDVFNENSNMLGFIIIGLISTGLFYKVFENKKYKQIKVLIMSLMYSFSSYLLIGNETFNVRNQKMIIAFIGILLFLYFSKLLSEGMNFNHIVINLVIHLGLGFLSTLLYYFLVLVIVELFKLHTEPKIILSIWVLIFTVIFTLYYTSRNKVENKILNNIFSMFLISFIFILYLGLFSKQQSFMMHLILWLGYIMAGINTVINKKYGPILTLPLLSYMIYIVIKQIKLYGITENRYFVLGFGLLLLAILILQLVRNIETSNYAKIFAMFIAIVFFIPYFNAFSLTERKMTYNFLSLYNLEKPTNEQKRNLNSYYEYLVSRNVNFKELDEYNKINVEDIHKNYYFIIEDEIKKIGNTTYVNIRDVKNEYIYTIKGKKVDLVQKIINKEFENKDYIIHPLNYSLIHNSHEISGHLELLIEEK
ncbi:DUF4153 domain-containing protein [Streptobacillus moniliformis]|uniref:DUF4153 domain-containing protein n=1 Tax=Streptobacillus moniliformis TaxID=34105 RepID=UPI0007E497A4|nr:DUF4153 domain-containing protein [Streptobacillus moniliformis]